MNELIIRGINKDGKVVIETYEPKVKDLLWRVDYHIRALQYNFPGVVRITIDIALPSTNK